MREALLGAQLADVGRPALVGPPGRELAPHQGRRRGDVGAAGAPAAARVDADPARGGHQARDPLAGTALAEAAKLGMDPRRAVGAPGAVVDLADQLRELLITTGVARGRPAAIPLHGLAYVRHGAGDQVVEAAPHVVLPAGHRRDVGLHRRVAVALGYLRVPARQQLRRPAGCLPGHRSPVMIGPPAAAGGRSAVWRTLAEPRRGPRPAGAGPGERQASAFALSASNCCWSITPLSSRLFAAAINPGPLAVRVLPRRVGAARRVDGAWRLDAEPGAPSWPSTIRFWRSRRWRSSTTTSWSGLPGDGEDRPPPRDSGRPGRHRHRGCAGSGPRPTTTPSSDTWTAAPRAGRTNRPRSGGAMTHSTSPSTCESSGPVGRVRPSKRRCEEAGESPARSRHCDRRVVSQRATASCRGGKAGVGEDPRARTFEPSRHPRSGRVIPRR